jgi:hypothetical protein
MDIDFHKAFLGNNLWEITMIRRAVPTQPMFRETAKPPAERSMALEVLSAG